MIDHKALLKKYLQHVLEVKDTLIFNRSQSLIKFTKEEFNELESLIGVTKEHENCVHEFKYRGHDNQWAIYQCTKCDKTEERV